MRLSKFIASSGLTSRRKAEELIREGKVRVNGRIVRNIVAHIDPIRDVVEVEGKKLKREKPVYIALYKPRGYLTAPRDPYGRPLVKELLKDLKVRVFPVGRLDFDSEGLLLLTNDGELSQRLTHPRYGVEKEYLVELDREPDDDIYSLLLGIETKDGKMKAEYIEKKGKNRIKVILKEGKKREIRRML
ncbi:pseudouridine synthase, partial [bacterium]